MFLFVCLFFDLKSILKDIIFVILSLSPFEVTTEMGQ